MRKGDSLSSEAFHYVPGQSLGYLVRDTSRLFTRSLQARIAKHGVTIGQWFFLRVLWEEDGLTQRELSRRVGTMEPTTVSAVSGMKKRGLIRRARNAADARKVNIYLTQKGRRLRDRLLPFAKQVNELAAAGLATGEIATLRRGLNRLKHNLDQDDLE